MHVRPTDEAAVRAALAVLDGRSADGDDIPVGAVVLDGGGAVLATGWNQRTSLHDPTAHAEIVAVRGAAAVKQTWRLSDCTLAVTLEPCPMCAGAAAAARIGRVVFGAWNPEYGAAGSAFDLLRDPRLPYRCEVVGGVLADECRIPITAFFARRRPGQLPPRIR